MCRINILQNAWLCDRNALKIKNKRIASDQELMQFFLSSYKGFWELSQFSEYYWHSCLLHFHVNATYANNDIGEMFNIPVPMYGF